MRLQLLHLALSRDVLLLKPSPISEMASCIKLGKGEVSMWHDPWLEQGSIAALIDSVNISNSDLQVKIFGTTENGILAQL